MEAIYEARQWHVHYVARGGIASFAISAVDIALWDLRGKRQVRPLWLLARDEPELRADNGLPCSCLRMIMLAEVVPPEPPSGRGSQPSRAPTAHRFAVTSRSRVALVWAEQSGDGRSRAATCRASCATRDQCTTPLAGSHRWPGQPTETHGALSLRVPQRQKRHVSHEIQKPQQAQSLRKVRKGVILAGKSAKNEQYCKTGRGAASAVGRQRSSSRLDGNLA